jgi:hypothetical protein
MWLLPHNQAIVPNSLKNRISERPRANHVYNTDMNRSLDLAKEVDTETRDIRS